MKEITLLDGTIVRMQSVPSMAIVEVVNQNPDLVEPPIPVVEVKGVAGVEKVQARSGEEVYEEWLRERARREMLRDKAFSNYSWDYGTISWKPPGSSEFTDKVPRDWKFPEKLKAYGMKPRAGKVGRRMDYIKIVLFALPADQEGAQVVMYGPVKPLTQLEVSATRDLFPGDQESHVDTVPTVD